MTRPLGGGSGTTIGTGTGLALHGHARACGKVILVGEHAVVHGYPAIAAAIEQGISLLARPAARRNAYITLRIPAWHVDLELNPANPHLVARACLEVLTFCDGPVLGWQIDGTADLPSRAGLGSSAALTVAIARLVLGGDAPAADLVAASMAGETVFHGEPSGIDSHVAASGGVLRYVRDTPPEALRVPRTLKLVVAPSGTPRSTADQVDKVARLRSALPQATRSILRALGALATDAESCIISNNFHQLGDIMNVAHHLLGALGVSTPQLDDMCHTARDVGSLGAKLTGAGGGGCVVALSDTNPRPICDRFAARGIDALVSEIAGS
ncbi:MAG: mevalonate kinase [Nannocystaceae bacterium]